MIKTAIAFLLGCLLCLNLTLLPDFSWWLIPILLAIIWLRHTVFTAFIVGLLWAGFQAHLQLNQVLPAQLAGKDILLSGEIISIPNQQDRQARFLFSPDNEQYPNKIRISWYQPPAVLPKSGEHWQFLVRLKSPHGMMNPGGFDYEKWLFMQGIGATAYIRSSPSKQRLDKASLCHINALRQQIRHKLQQLPELQQLAMLQGLAVGIRDDLNTQHWQILRQTGTSHLLAISGLHIGLAAAVGFFVFRWLWSLSARLLLRAPAQQVGAIGGLGLAVFYACLAGLSVPTQRALIMVTIVMLALLLKRTTYPMHLLAFSMLIVLIFDPFAAMSAGFCLSFAAVALIIYTCTQRYPANRWNWALIHLWIAIGLIPLLLLFFGQISLISPLANLIAVPLVSLLVVPLILLGILLLPISDYLAMWLLKSADFFLNLLWQGLELLAASPYADWQTTNLSWPLICLVAIAILMILLPKSWPAKWLALLFLLPAAYYQPTKPESGHFYLSLLDVGQGLSVVIETEQHTLVFDTGPKYSDSFDTGRSVVIPFLQYRGIKHVDKMIISHADNDHIGGARSVINALPIVTLLSSDRKALANAKICQKDQKWQWDQVRFEILHPRPDDSGSKNNLSCVLKVTGKNRSALLPGDIEKQTEFRLVRGTANKLRADILIVPHHGSNTSSSESFIRAVQPDYALFAVGNNNRYGFPTQTVIERYQQDGIELLRTDINGAILFKDDSHPIRWRQLNSHFWTSNATE
jgi:competence protein ComEC